MRSTNTAFLSIAKRAERQDEEILKNTFVDFGSIFSAISSIDHQIVFGRRGTGKTHLFTVLRQKKTADGEIAIQLDMRNLGSAGGIYADPSLPLSLRATRLLIDVLTEIHASLLGQAIEHDGPINLGVAGTALDTLFDACRTVKVVGPVAVETTASTEIIGRAEVGLGVSIATMGALSGGTSAATSEGEKASIKKSVTGYEIPRVNFGSVGGALRKVVETLPNRRLWILLDEWSEVPLDLQPYLADLLRRAVLPTKGITVKIAAIEQRSRLFIPESTVGNVGLELGADISAAINLDDYMVFDNDEQKAVAFFKALVLKHVQAASEPDNGMLRNERDLMSQGFTQVGAFEECVRACEGVPRDAIHILSHAAQRANENAISVLDIREAAQQWYYSSKDSAVAAHEQAKRLLLWIIDKVIKERQTKAFLLESRVKDNLIDFLYDERVIHILRKGMSAKDSPGKRFNVYGIDYGCYVDLVNTAKAPRGILDLGEDAAEFSATVPKTDFRSIRRCVLDLPDFYKEDTAQRSAVEASS